MSKHDKHPKPKSVSGNYSRLLAYMQLLRLPNLFTAMADVAMGFIFARATAGMIQFEWGGVAELAAIILVSSLLYLSGMVLNDWFDVDVDRRERPDRPLPSGRITLAAAALLGWGLLVSGVVVSLAVGYWLSSVWPIVVAAALAVCIVLYDGALKRTPLGPVVMGGCRALNVLLGMSVVGGICRAENFLVACAVGVYIAGVTFYARNETGGDWERDTRQSSEVDDARRGRGETAGHVRMRLLLAVAVMMSGIVVLGKLPDLVRLTMPAATWQMFMLLLGVLIAWQCLRPIIDLQPRRVQTAIKQSIFSLVLLDASVVLGVAGPWPAIAVLALLIPAVLTGWWVYTT